MIAILAAVVGASLAGSLHCVGMCGPIVAFYSAADGAPRRAQRMLMHAGYHLGRLLTLLLAGLALGGLGAALDLAGAAARIQDAALLLCGAVMVLWGGASLLSALGLRRRAGGGEPGLVQRTTTRLMAGSSRRPPLLRTLLLGLLTPLLPCGWLWAFAVAAAGSGDPLMGALVLVAFWLGSVPALLGLGAGLQLLAAPLRRHLPVVTAVILVLVGLLALSGRVPLAGKLPSLTSVKPVTVQQVRSIRPARASCCAGKNNARR